jgi:hypothetical protein
VHTGPGAEAGAADTATGDATVRSRRPAVPCDASAVRSTTEVGCAGARVSGGVMACPRVSEAQEVVVVAVRCWTVNV